MSCHPCTHLQTWLLQRLKSSSVGLLLLLLPRPTDALKASCLTLLLCQGGSVPSRLSLNWWGMWTSTPVFGASSAL